MGLPEILLSQYSYYTVPLKQPRWYLYQFNIRMLAHLGQIFLILKEEPDPVAATRLIDDICADPVQ